MDDAGVEPLTWTSITGAALRQDISRRAVVFARTNQLLHAVSDGESPSILFGVDERGRHGNFHPAAYRAVCGRPDWARRLTKVHTLSRRMSVRSDWQWRELDCAHSSDALLMNVFCHPASFRAGELGRALSVNPDARPEFGYHPRLPLRQGRTDQTEIDMKLGSLLVEAKLTESGLQTASLAELIRYRDFDEVFHVNEIPRRNGKIEGYQLVRGILAAFLHGGEFCLLCDSRRRDLIYAAFGVFVAVRSADLRCRLKIATWQELSTALPRSLRTFLMSKYGITGA